MWALDLRYVTNSTALWAYLEHLPPSDHPATTLPPYCILLDLADGQAVLTILKSAPTFRIFPVIIWMTTPTAQELRHAYDPRCNAVVYKLAPLDRFVDRLHILGTYWFQMVILLGPTT